MPVYAMSTFARCVVVAQRGTPILFEHPNSMHRSLLRTPDVRPMHAWEFFDDPGAEADVWADLALDALRELGAGVEVVAVDRLGTPGFLALARRGVAIVDAAPVTQRARQVKTAQELLPLDRAEATDRRLEDGDLVFVDTDTVGIEGMFSCVSRTFLAGGSPPTREQADVYRAAHAWLTEMEALIRPGIACADLAAVSPAIPARFHAQRYECMVHGIGLEEENPSVCHPSDPQSNPETVLERDMALVVEIFAGEIGSAHGVKLGDQVVVTDEGCRVLCPYPFSAPLLD
jgi:Xaa-Pro aminopeptidase